MTSATPLRPAIVLVSAFLLAILGVAAGASWTFAADAFPEPRGYVNDFANTIESATQNRLEQFLTEVDRQLGVQVAVVTMRDLGGDDPTEYANQLFAAWGIGGKQSNRGLLILDAKQERFFRVEVGYGLEGVLPDGRVGRILDESVIPYLREGQDALAYVAATRELLVPVLEEAGQDPGQLDQLVSSSGYQLRRSGGRSPLGGVVPFIVILLVLWAASRGGRGGGGGVLPYLILTGMSRGSGGGGGGGFGGFGGFGGGLSGGGGAGRGY